MVHISQYVSNENKAWIIYGIDSIGRCGKTTQTVNETLTASAPAIISGSGLLVKGDHADVGVYFTPDGDGKVPIKVALIVQNTTSQIIIQLPALADGSYTLSVTTQAGSNYKLLKEPRTYHFPIVLTVSEESDRPEEI